MKTKKMKKEEKKKQDEKNNILHQKVLIGFTFGIIAQIIYLIIN